MTARYIEFNGITFKEDTYFPFYSFTPNEGNVEFQTDSAVLKDGAIFSNSRYTERTVTLKGHVVGKNEKDLIENKQLLFIKSNGKTKSELVYFDGFDFYKAEAIGSIPVLSEKMGLCYEFTITFTLPGFYWKEKKQTLVPLFLRKNEIEDTFTLPCVFTSRTAGNTYFNETDFSILPKIEIIAEDSTEYDLVIENENTGATIELLEFAVTEGDIIVIDLEEMTATHNGVDIVNLLNDFSDFFLVPGMNKINVTNGGLEVNSTALIKFYKKIVGI